MFENRNLKQDLFAIGLLAVIAFLFLALISYSPADPISPPGAPFNLVYTPDTLAFPQNETITNRCGYGGAVIADILLNSLGLGAYFLVGSLLWVDIVLIRRKTLESPWLRSVGWTVTLIGFASLSTLLVPSLTLGPIVGPGGYLGAMCGGLLESQFATLGAVIVSLSVFVSGVLLYTDYAVLRVAKWVAVHLLAVGYMTAAARPAKGLLKLPSRSAKPTVESDVSELEETEEVVPEASEPSIRIAGRKLGEVVDDYEEAEAEDESEFEPEEEDETELEREADEAVEDAEEEDGDIPVKVPAKKQEAPSAVHQAPHFKVKKPEKSERETVINELNKASHTELTDDYELPDIDLLQVSEEFCFEEQEVEVRKKAQILEKTFGEFGFKVKVVEIETGPVIAQYEIQLEAGLRLSKITGLSDDLAIALRVPSVRIVAPIPGKNTVGIEVPNEARQVVRLREVMETSTAQTRKMKIPLYLGKDVSGNPLVADLASLPHLLIAGRTGTGKSVCLNAIISSMLMTRRPDEVRMLMIDPKMVELSGYGRLPHLMHPVVTDMKKAEAILAWAVDKMEERYALLAQAGVRHITTYNQLGEAELMRRLAPENEEQQENIPLHLPFIVIVADEMADLMMTAGKEVEQHIIRLAQKSRAVGIHLILATQKPTVDVITGLIKSNLPARIAFQVASRTDSRVVLDEMGADKLLGNGDMLFLGPGTSTLLRGQGTYLSDEEIDAVTNEVSTGEQHFVNELVNLKVEAAEGAEDRMAELKKRDELYESAIDVVVREGRGSVSLLQRALGIGYGRAARLVDFMAEDNIVGPYAGSQAREVLVSIDEWQAMQGLSEGGSSTPSTPAPAASRRTPIKPQASVMNEPPLELEEEESYSEEELGYDEELQDENESELLDEEETDEDDDLHSLADDDHEYRIDSELDDDSESNEDEIEAESAEHSGDSRSASSDDHRIHPSGSRRRLPKRGQRRPVGRGKRLQGNTASEATGDSENEDGRHPPAPKGRSTRKPRQTKLMASRPAWKTAATEWNDSSDPESGSSTIDKFTIDELDQPAVGEAHSGPAIKSKVRKGRRNRIRLQETAELATGPIGELEDAPPIVRAGKRVSDGKWSLAKTRSDAELDAEFDHNENEGSSDIGLISEDDETLDREWDERDLKNEANPGVVAAEFEEEIEDVELNDAADDEFEATDDSDSEEEELEAPAESFDDEEMDEDFDEDLEEEDTEGESEEEELWEEEEEEWEEDA